MERIALFGGTFDPPHLGHLVIAETVREALRLDRVEFVPAPDPPHKANVARSPFADRLAMVELAIAGTPGFLLNRSESLRQGPSFTVDTLRLRRVERPDEALWFLIGADSLLDLPNWRDPGSIIRLARLAVAGRPDSPLDINRVERALPGVTAATDIVATPLIDISSRDLRRRVREGLSIRFRTPAPVVEMIHAHELYRSETVPRPTSRVPTGMPDRV